MSKQQFQVGDESLAGELIGIEPQLLVLHGAGRATRDRAKPLLDQVVKETGQGAFMFDFSGHGESSGELSASSLQKRVAEADAAWQFLSPDKPITIFGFSMGGHIALELLKDHAVENLILFYPGIYTSDAFDLPFNEKFSEAIRQPNSWRNASVLQNLENFKGGLLIVWGENDAVVSRDVVELLYKSAGSARSRELFVVPHGEHLLLPQLYADDALNDEVVTKIKALS